MEEVADKEQQVHVKSKHNLSSYTSGYNENLIEYESLSEDEELDPNLYQEEEEEEQIIGKMEEDMQVYRENYEEASSEEDSYTGS